MSHANPPEKSPPTKQEPVEVLQKRTPRICRTNPLSSGYSQAISKIDENGETETTVKTEITSLKKYPKKHNCLNTVMQGNYRNHTLSRFSKKEKKDTEDKYSFNKPSNSYTNMNSIKKRDSRKLPRILETQIMSVKDITKSPESSAEDFLQESKNIYKKFLELIKKSEIESEYDFKNQAAKENQKVVGFLTSKLLSLNLPKEKINAFVNNLEVYIKYLDENTIEIMKKEQLQVVGALTLTRSFYQEEMEKIFESKKFLPNFQELNKRVVSRATFHCNTSYKLTSKQNAILLKAMNTIEKEYEERNFLRVSQDSIAIGIDLGTTNSCVSVFMDGKATVIPNEFGKHTTPSYVAFLKGSFVVGEKPKYSHTYDPQSTTFDVKRFIGRQFSDPIVQNDIPLWPFKIINSDENIPKIKLEGRTFFAEEISARILLHMKNIAEKYLNVDSIQHAVVTVPAYFNNGQRQATKDAGEIAGLNILKIINEPTAAAIAYNLHRKEDLKRNVFIFDLGGGTLDVAVLTIVGGEIQVKAVDGDTHLGGQDFDTEIVKYCLSKFKEENKINLLKIPNTQSSKILKRIRNECEKEKCNLSSAEETEICIESIYRAFLKIYDLKVLVTRNQFEELNQNNFDRCIIVVERVLKSSEVNKKDIDDIVLIGGSTRIPKIQEMLENFFEGKSLCKMLNQDEAVACGAAVQASILIGKRAKGFKETNVTAKDVTSMTIGIQNDLTKELDVVIKKGTEISCERRIVCETMKDGQKAMLFRIFEGEDFLVAKNNFLMGEFRLENIPMAKGGDEKVELRMEISEEGILHVNAIARSNRSFSSITITSLQGRLSKDAIHKLKLK